MRIVFGDLWQNKPVAIRADIDDRGLCEFVAIFDNMGREVHDIRARQQFSEVAAATWEERCAEIDDRSIADKEEGQ